MNDVTVEKIGGAKPATLQVKNFRTGDVVDVPCGFGTYVILGPKRPHGSSPPKNINIVTRVDALHILEDDGSDAALRLTTIDVDDHCTIVGRLRNLQWSGL